MSNGGSVTEDVHMVDMVARAKERWGGVHILINNAGVLRDKSFAKMEPADFGFVVDVHLIGSANCTKAVWETMREQQYGRRCGGRCRPRRAPPPSPWRPPIPSRSIGRASCRERVCQYV